MCIACQPEEPRMLHQVDETVGFAEDEESLDALVSDERDEGHFVEDMTAEDNAMKAEGQPRVC